MIDSIPATWPTASVIATDSAHTTSSGQTICNTCGFPVRPWTPMYRRYLMDMLNQDERDERFIEQDEGTASEKVDTPQAGGVDEIIV